MADPSSALLSRSKEKWDGLAEVERRDFIARVAAEADFKAQRRRFAANSLSSSAAQSAPPQYYEPSNYYGRFLRRQLEDLEAAEESRRTLKDGRKIKLNSAFLRELYYTVWQQRLSEGHRRHYRENSNN